MACSAPAADVPERGQPAAETYPEYGATPGKICQERGLGRFLGQRWTNALALEARDASGSRSVRIVRPRDLITQDRRRDRLNLTLDEGEVVVGARCF